MKISGRAERVVLSVGGEWTKQVSQWTKQVSHPAPDLCTRWSGLV